MDRIDFSVSVIMPAFNAERYIAEALGSVLSQTCPALEVIVVDDGSVDGTREIVGTFANVRYVHQENAGVAAALNRGCSLVHGNHVAFISADDIWRPDKLLQQKARLLQRPNALVFGHMMNFISPDLSPQDAQRIACPKDPMPAYSAGTLLTSIKTFNQVGSFNEAYDVGEFMDWYGRATDQGIDVLMMEDIVSQRRLHDANHSTKVLSRKSYAPVLKALLDRRRARET